MKYFGHWLVGIWVILILMLVLSYLVFEIGNYEFAGNILILPIILTSLLILISLFITYQNYTNSYDNSQYERNYKVRSNSIIKLFNTPLHIIQILIPIHKIIGKLNKVKNFKYPRNRNTCNSDYPFRTHPLLPTKHYRKDCTIGQPKKNDTSDFY